MVTLWHGGTRPGVHFAETTRGQEMRSDKGGQTVSVLWHVPAILPCMRQRQEVHDFETNLVYITNSGQPGSHSKALSERKQNSGVTGAQAGQYTVAGTAPHQKRLLHGFITKLTVYYLLFIP